MRSRSATGGLVLEGDLHLGAIGDDLATVPDLHVELRDLRDAKISEALGGEIHRGRGGALVGDVHDVDVCRLLEKLARDVGLKVACIDFLENMEQAREEYLAYQGRDILNEMGAQTIGKVPWYTITESQPPKQIVQRRIILPLIQQDLSKKHGVVPPKTIIFFGPPGTGKTHFAKAIAGALSWWFIEIAPSMLMVDGSEKLGANLRLVMEKSRKLEEAVIFIDEFEEIAGSRDEASRVDKSITNEFLKQVPLLKNQGNNVLLVCKARSNT